jgi:hypothetical protein
MTEKAALYGEAIVHITLQRGENGICVKLLPRPHPWPRERTDALIFQRTQRAIQLRGALACAYCVIVQNSNTISTNTVP